MILLSLFPMILLISNKISSKKKKTREMKTLTTLIWSQDQISQTPHVMISFRGTLTTCSKNIIYTMTLQLFQKKMKISVRSWTCPLQSMGLTPTSSQTSRKSKISLPKLTSIVLLNRSKRTQNIMNQHFN